MRCRLLVFLFTALAGSAARGAATSKYLVADLRGANRVDYLILCGDRFVGGVDRLAEHRAKQGYAVGVVRMSAVRAGFGTVRRFLGHAVRTWKKPAPSYLLLVGDVDAIPAVVKRGALRGWRSSPDLATDYDYARPLGDRVCLHVGRFPCDTPAELGVMVDKTIAYETTLPGGAWQRKLNLVASVGGYGKHIDGLLESVAMQIASSNAPPEYDAQAAYGSPSSPYCPYPPRFNEHVIDMFNAGSLLYLFVGHGSTRGADSIRWKGRRYPTFSAGDARRLKAAHGLPVLLIVACHTGRYDAADCLGETYLKAPKGPVAFIGGSRVTQPYGNALFARAFIQSFLGGARTVGAALTRAKLAVAAHRLSMLRLQADTVGAAMQGRENLKRMRDDVVQHYNLLGDPALVIRKPSFDIRLTLKGSTVHLHAPRHKTLELRLECDRVMFLHPVGEIDPDDPQYRRKVSERYRKAHDKVLRRWNVELKEGRASVDFPRPKQPGRYYLRAFAGSSVGAAGFVVKPPEG